MKKVLLWLFEYNTDKRMFSKQIWTEPGLSHIEETVPLHFQAHIAYPSGSNAVYVLLVT